MASISDVDFLFPGRSFSLAAADGLIFKEKNSLLNLITAIGLKDVVDPVVANLQKKYHKLYLSHHSYVKFNFALNLLREDRVCPKLGIQTPIQKKEIESLIKHRGNVLRYANSINRMGMSAEDVHRVVEALKIDINLLGDAENSKITLLLDGTTCFTLPGGWSDHAVYYSFKKQGESYFFELHNRSHLGDDSRLHGAVHFEIEKKAYAKTVVLIKTSKEDLQNEQFLRILVEACFSPDSHLAYDCIYAHFILSRKGQIVKSKEEVLLEDLHQQFNNPFVDKIRKQEIINASYSLVKLDPNFNSLQPKGYLTCVESNITTLEQRITSDAPRWAVRKFILEQLLKELVISDEEAHSVDMPIFIVETSKVINKLQRKLASTAEKALSRMSSDHKSLAEEPTIKFIDLVTKLPVPVMTEQGAKEKIASIVKTFNSFPIEELFGCLLKGVNLRRIEKFTYQCALIQESLRSGSLLHLKECEDLQSIISVLNFFINNKREEKFDEGRLIKQDFATVFDKIDKQIQLSIQGEIPELSLETMAEMLDALLKRLNEYPKKSELSQIFLIQCKNQCNILISKVLRENILNEKFRAIIDSVLSLQKVMAQPV